jgi:hypothetical protein
MVELCCREREISDEEWKELATNSDGKGWGLLVHDPTQNYSMLEKERIYMQVLIL